MTDALPHAPALAAALDGRPMLLLALYCVLIVGASLAGGWLPGMVRLTHVRTQVLVSFVAGLMLGISLLHLLPHAVAEIGRTDAALDREIHGIDTAVRWTLGGLLGMFFLIRMFHFHHHGEIELAAEPHGHVHGPDCGPDAAHGHDEGRAHDHDHSHSRATRHDGHAREPHSHPRSAPGPHGLSWLGVFVGLALHTLIDGMALAASVRAEAAHSTGLGVYGVGTFLAILLHKPLDAVSITSLMAAGGWSPRWRNAVNAGFALMCPLGAVLLVLGAERLAEDSSLVVGCALAFSAGVFLCISLGDLLPEVEFHSHDRLKLSLALLLGIALAWAIGLIEPAHVHGAAEPAPLTRGTGV
jgi:zinc and cadmium transporter